MPRRPLSPEGFKYPNLMAKQEAHGFESAAAYRGDGSGARSNACAKPIQSPFQRTRYPAFLEIDHGSAPFPIQGPPEKDLRRYEDCDCDDYGQQMETTRYPTTLDIDYGVMHFPLRGPERYKRDYRDSCGANECGGPNERTNAVTDSNERDHRNYPIQEQTKSNDYEGENRCDDNYEPCYRDQRALQGSAIEEQYQRMCQEREGDRGFCPEACNGRAKEKEEVQINNEFFSYRAEIVQQPWESGQTRGDDCNCRPFRLAFM